MIISDFTKRLAGARQMDKKLAKRTKSVWRVFGPFGERRPAPMKSSLEKLLLRIFKIYIINILFYDLLNLVAFTLIYFENSIKNLTAIFNTYRTIEKLC